MNTIRLVPFLSIFSILVGCGSAPEYFADAYCLTNINVLDMEKGFLPNRTVVISQDRIQQIIPSEEINLSDQNTIIDGEGQYLIPGLWDAHVHFAFMDSLAPYMFDLFLGYGITSVRDTGGEIGFVKQWQEEANANLSTAPRVMIAGPLLDGLPNVYDGSDPLRPPLSKGLASPADVASYISFLDSLDVDLLKAYEMLTPEQFETVTSSARERGLKVTGHVPLSMDVISASNAGLNSMEHMRNLELSCASNADELLELRREMLLAGRDDLGGVLRSRIHDAQRKMAIANYDENKADEVLTVLKQNDTWQIPTLALSTGAVKRPFAKETFQTSFDYLPASIKSLWLQSIENFGAIEPTAFQKEYASWMFNMVKKVYDKEIPIMAGTDCPIFFLTPGRSLHTELETLVDAGIDPLEAIKMATVNPAVYFNLESKLGTIETGKLADLVILNKNPLEDIRNTLTIDAVIRNGTYLNRGTLDQMLLPDEEAI